MSKKNSKKQAKAERQARREEAARRERRRNLASVGVVALVVMLGGALIAYSIWQDRDAEAQAAAEMEAMQSELAASEAVMASELATRQVACGAERPMATPASEPAPPTFEAPETVLEEGVDYAAVIETSCGTVRIDLAEDRAPEAVNAFVSLAREGFYDGLEIFRNATSIGALQTGSATNDATYDVGFTLTDELGFAEEEGYPPGAVALANSGPNTSGSQFFFVYNDVFDEAFADNRAYTRFATVTEGLDVLEEIGAIEVTGMGGETPSQLVYLESVEIVEG